MPSILGSLTRLRQRVIEYACRECGNAEALGGFEACESCLIDDAIVFHERMMLNYADTPWGEYHARMFTMWSNAPRDGLKPVWFDIIKEIKTFPTPLIDNWKEIHLDLLSLHGVYGHGKARLDSIPYYRY